MHATRHRRVGWLLPLVALMLGLAVIPAAAQTSVPSDGVVCTTNPSATFSLTATDGYISLPDGNTIYMWGYAEDNRGFQHPGPVLCVNQGDTVTVALHNTLAEDVSIIFPGQDNVLANGAPAQPQFSAGTMTSLTNVAANGGDVTYSFTASRPGTYLYESGTQPGKQVQMGLFGALVVRPTDAGFGPNFAYNRSDSEFDPSAEFMALLSEIDPILHQAVERNMPYDLNSYTARYFMINGRSFPDTIAPNDASWLPSQPYGALARIHPATAASKPALIRYLSVGPQIYPFHPHGNNSLVIGRDGRPLAGPAAEDLSYEKFSIPVGPGQTWDALFSWKDAESWDATTNPIPVTVPQQQNIMTGPYWSGSPYLGNQGSFPVGTENYNQCGEYYHVAHNHALQAITAWGITMSGQITYTRIDPPLPNTCP
jgi:FtsP/CotA-like multicopper oxidase with cupredoxin domain